MVTWAPGYKSCTAMANRCAVEWRITSTPSESRVVMMASSASSVIFALASTSWPLTRPARVALASPGPISWATSITETASANSRLLPSGRVITGIERVLTVLDSSVATGTGGCLFCGCANLYAGLGTVNQWQSIPGIA